MLEAALGRLVESLPGRARMMVILRYQEDLDPTRDRCDLGDSAGDSEEQPASGFERSSQADGEEI